MKILIASDIHGSALFCRRLMEAWDREEPDRVLLLGDLLYHGPRNDLPEEYNPKQVIALLNERKESLLCVRGNCDTEVDQMVLRFPIMADYAVLTLGDRLLYASHGHHYGENNPPALRKGDILLCGHTHGGVIRVPGIGGLYAPMQGWWPRYDYGDMMLNDDMRMIITSGLSGHDHVPRIFNLPEIAVIDLKP